MYFGDNDSFYGIMLVVIGCMLSGKAMNAVMSASNVTNIFNLSLPFHRLISVITSRMMTPL